MHPVDRGSIVAAKYSIGSASAWLRPANTGNLDPVLAVPTGTRSRNAATRRSTSKGDIPFLLLLKSVPAKRETRRRCSSGEIMQEE